MPRIIKSLNPLEVKEKSKRPGSFSVGGVPGLTLVVVPLANDELGKYWVLRKQGANGFKFSLGPYPQISLKQARLIASEKLQAIALGDINPVVKKKELAQERKAELEAQRAKPTIREVYMRFFDWKEARGEWKNSREARFKAEQRFYKHIVLKHGHIEIDSATPDDVADMLRDLWCDKRATADKLLPLIRALFAWAMVVEKIRSKDKANPALRDSILPLLPAERMRKKTEHFPYLMPDQLPAFMRALHQTKTVSYQCTEFAVLCALRSQNARGAKWADIDMEKRLWVIPEEEMKISANGQHIIPLSNQAYRILEERLVVREMTDSPYVFPSSKGDMQGMLSATSLNMVIKRLHKAEKLKGNEGWIDREQTEKAGKERVAVQHAISRATFETWAQAERKDARAIKLCLHHDVDSLLKSAYDRDKSIEEKRQLLQDWADFACSLYED